MAARLTAIPPLARPTLRDRFERDGSIRIPGALTDAEVARYRRAVDRVAAAHASEGMLHRLAFLGDDPTFVNLLDHRATLPLVRQVLGDNIHCYHCHLDVHPGAETPRNVWLWHQDGGVVNRDLETSPRPRLSVKVAFFLSDVSIPGRGNLVVLPGSQRTDRMEPPADGSNDLPGAQPILADAGDAVMFDRRLWHMRSPNTSAFTRSVLFLAYTYRWIRPRDDMPMPSDVVAAASPAQRQLLGIADAAIDHWSLGEPPALAARAHATPSSGPAR
ncbi:MAG TPA: phytanoyl-CoA dioxygenase family protein [Actinomycetota bacterium]|jgi:ectoine hydroxylase|nr:phytanoyl-CoA dioxygenase family protein [Actinomycetota bacterium]